MLGLLGCPLVLQPMVGLRQVDGTVGNQPGLPGRNRLVVNRGCMIVCGSWEPKCVNMTDLAKFVKRVAEEKKEEKKRRGGAWGPG